MGGFALIYQSSEKGIRLTDFKSLSSKELPAKEGFLAVLPTLVHGGGEELDVEEVVAAQRALNLLNHTPAMFHFVIIYLLSSLDSYQHNCFHTLNKN